MKNFLASFVVIGSLATGLMGCAYGGAAGIGTDKVVVLRNDGFLFGALRKAVVCKVAENGLTACQENETP
jgi:hypothetical protein